MRKDKEQTRLYNLLYRQNNPEKVKQSRDSWRKTNKVKAAAYNKAYTQTPKGRYVQQKVQATKRGIDWELSFEEWFSIWQNSGHWEERGFGKDKYCMCRFGDTGPYSATNVCIATTELNKGRRV